VIRIKILFSGGGTLGHIYPLVSVCEELKRQGATLYFIGTKAGLEKEFIEEKKLFFKTYYFDSEGLKRKLNLRNILVIYKHLKNIKRAKKIIKNEKIDLVIGMGGFISASIIIAAKQLKVKTLIHEQNAKLGLANRLVKNKVDKVLLSYPISNIKNGVVVGNPRVSEVYEMYKNINLRNDYLLVVGGSRGAKRINDLIIELREDLRKNNINVILITGNNYYKENKEKIEKIITKDFQIIPFSKEFLRLLANAKVVMSRAGATTLAEITALRKVSMIIPSPNVTNNHQEENAKFLEKINGSIIIKEANLNKDLLFDVILKLYNNQNVRMEIINNLNFNIKVDAKELFLKEIKNVLIGNNYSKI